MNSGQNKNSLRLATPRRQVPISFCAGCFVLFIVLTAIRSLAKENQPSLNFLADGIFSVKTFHPNNSTPTAEVQGRFSFLYTNQIWEIQIYSQTGHGNGVDSVQLEKTILNCKKINDGIRYYVTQKAAPSTLSNQGMIQAFAEPIPFPPPGQKALLLCWLSLCPNAELPMIDSTRGRRFLSVGLLKAEKNKGEYSKSYLSPQNIFLSKLVIFNDGIEFITETETLQLAPPFNRGYREFEFLVSESATFQQCVFPTKTVLQEFAPGENPKSRDDTYPTMIGTLEVSQVRIGDEAANHAIASVGNVLAVDRRPQRDTVIRHIITNDQWVPATNRQLATLASMTRAHSNRTVDAGPNRRSLVLAILIATALIFPIIWLKFGRRST